MASSTIIELSKGLYCLPNPYELDGRLVSTHPVSARGFATLNTYVYAADGEALLIDTAWPVNKVSMLEQLATVVQAETPLSLFCLRQTDYNSVSNALPISESFNVTRVILGGGVLEKDIHRWLDFDPSRTAWRQPNGVSRLAHAEQWSPMGASYVAGPGDVELELVRSKLQTLATYWLYDPESLTLFTSDAFSHVWRSTADGPWFVTEVSDAPTVGQLCDYLVGSRFWWLAGANTVGVRESLDELRSSHDIRRIAPAYGCILMGEDVVCRHFDLMDEALALLNDWLPVGDDLVFYVAERG